jgi:hypothetical protein
MMIITTIGGGKKRRYITKESHQVFFFGTTNRKISFGSPEAASGEKRGAERENLRCINIIKIKNDGWQLL